MQLCEEDVWVKNIRLRRAGTSTGTHAPTAAVSWKCKAYLHLFRLVEQSERYPVLVSARAVGSP